METMEEMRERARAEDMERARAPLYFAAAEIYRSLNETEPQAIEVRATVDDRAVGGVTYGPEPVTLPLNGMEPEEIEALYADPLIAVRLV